MVLFYPNPLSPWRPGDFPPLSSMKRLPLVLGDSVRPRYFSPLGERGGVWPRGPPFGECGVACVDTTKRGGGAF